MKGTNWLWLTSDGVRDLALDEVYWGLDPGDTSKLEVGDRLVKVSNMVTYEVR